MDLVLFTFLVVLAELLAGVSLLVLARFGRDLHAASGSPADQAAVRGDVSRWRVAAVAVGLHLIALAAIFSTPSEHRSWGALVILLFAGAMVATLLVAIRSTLVNRHIYRGIDLALGGELPIHDAAKGMPESTWRRLEEMESRASLVTEMFVEWPYAILFLFDSTGHVVKCSAAAAEELGWSREELSRLPFSEFVTPEDRPATIEAYKRFRSTDADDVVGFTNRWITKAGALVRLSWVDWCHFARSGMTLCAAVVVEE